MQILSWEDLQLTDLKCLLIPQEIFFMLNCSFEFIQQLSEVQGEFEWAPQTTGKTEIKGHLQTELSSGSMSTWPLDRATFTGSVTRTDTQSLTQNTFLCRCQFQRRMPRSRRIWKTRTHRKHRFEFISGVCDANWSGAREERKISTIPDSPMVQRVCTCTCQTT